MKIKRRFADLFVLLSIIFLSSSETENIAFMKPAYQSSVFPSTETGCQPMDASKAVDGDRNPDVFQCHCSLINDIYGDPNWWAVDLLGVYTMDYVVVYNRQTLPERLNNFWVGFTKVDINQSHPQRGLYPLCGQYPGKMILGVVGTVKCNYNLPPARYLIIQKDLNALDGNGMCICEVEAFPLKRNSGFLWKMKPRLKLSGYSYYDWNYKASVQQCIFKCIASSTRCDSFNENPDLKLCTFNFHPFGFNTTSLEVVAGWKFWSAARA